MSWDAERYANDPAYREARLTGTRDRKRKKPPPGWAAFGGTQALFDKLFQRQGERCGICDMKLVRRSPDNRSGIAHFDHDHVTMKPRGILCFSCNQKLGWYEKNRDAVERYLS